jgi:hypothetical protein
MKREKRFFIDIAFYGQCSGVRKFIVNAKTKEEAKKKAEELFNETLDDDEYVSEVDVKGYSCWHNDKEIKD